MSGASNALAASSVGRGHSTALSLAGARVAVHSDDATALDWLEEALAPSFAALVPEPDDVVVEFVPATSAEPEPPAPDGELLPCFAFESELFRLPGRREGEEVVLDDPAWGIRIAVRPRRVVLRRTRELPFARLDLMRVVRELALAQVLRRSRHLQVHASAVAWHGRGIAFAGPKFAGKTTTMATLAARTDAAILANDRILIDDGPGTCSAAGVPSLVKVRPETIELLPDQFRTVPDVPFRSPLSVREYVLAGQALGYVRGPGEVFLTPPQLAHELGSGLSARVPLSCLAVLSIDPSVDHFEVDPLTPEERDAAAQRFSFGWPRDPGERTVLERMVNAGAPRLGAPSAPNLRGVRGVRLRIGAGLAGSAIAPERLLRTLLPE